MNSIENKAVDYLSKRAVVVYFWAVTALSVIVRFFCRGFVSGDAILYLLPWYDEIKALGSGCLSQQVGDYNILYQTIIYLFTLLPVKPLYAYKCLSIIFDYALAIIVALIADEGTASGLTNRLNSVKFVGFYSAVILSPLVFLNSACWAQCDSIYSFFVFAALYAYMKKRTHLTFILYGIAFAFKFQSIFALPFFILLYVAERKHSILKFLYIPLMLVVSALPGILNGRNILDPFTIYFNQTETYSDVSMNYNSFWNCLINAWPGANNDYKEFKIIAVCFTAWILGMIVLWVIKHNITIDNTNIIFFLHLIVYTCILFLPTMHERYSYIYEITAIILMFKDKKFFFPGIGVILLSCMTYGYCMFELEYPILSMSFLNVFIYAWYVYVFVKSKQEWGSAAISGH